MFSELWTMASLRYNAVLLLLLVGLLSVDVSAKKYYEYENYDTRPYHNKYDGKERARQYKNYDYDYDRGYTPNRGPQQGPQQGPPPPATEVAKMARFIVHNTDWASVATISSQPPTRSFPFVNVFSMSDGPVSNGSGIPYFYLTPFDMSSQDAEQDNRCSISMTLAQTDYCKKQNIDPEDPRCAHVIFTGKLKRVKTHKPELDFSREALFSRHPVMKNWPSDHGWYFAKLKIEQIVVLDYFGGPKFVGVREYLSLPPQTEISSRM